MSKGESKEYRTRLKEITSVLHKYGITRGITPQKLRMILEDLGPTYIKIGQIMSLHSDILPKRYCDELMCLRSEVTPMEFPEVKEVIEQAYGCPWNEILHLFPIHHWDQHPLHRSTEQNCSAVNRLLSRFNEQAFMKLWQEISDSFGRQ